MAYIYFPGVPPINGGTRTASDHKDWLNDLLTALEDTMFAVFATNGGMTGVLRSAVFTNVYNQLLVQATNSMHVLVLPGVAIGHTNLWWLRSITHLDPMTAPVTNPRWDLVQAEIDNRQLSIKTGTESATPSKPSADANAVALASIYHRVGETVIKDTDDGTNGFIDLSDRVWAHPNFSLGYCWDVNLSAGAGLVDKVGLTYNSSTLMWEPTKVMLNFNRPIILTAEGMTAAVTNGCGAAAAVELATNATMISYRPFDQSTNEIGFWNNLILPKNTISTITTIKLRLQWTAAVGSVGQTVRWKVYAGCIANDEALDLDVSTSVQVIEDVLLATYDNHVTSEVTITLDGTPGPGNRLIIKVERDASHVNDTLAADALLMGAEATYVMDN